MSLIITEECINCGACQPECPNTAIYAGGVNWEMNGASNPALSAEFYYIVPEKLIVAKGELEKTAFNSLPTRIRPRVWSKPRWLRLKVGCKLGWLASAAHSWRH